MPSPAVDTEENSMMNGSFTYRDSWWADPGTTIPVNRSALSLALKHPATVVNAPDETGRRPMSGWSKSWFRGVCQAMNYSFSISHGGTTTWDYTNVPAYRLPQYANTPWFNSDVVGLAPWSPSLEFFGDNLARTNVLNKLAQKKWDLGVAAIEMKQTAGLVTDLATSLVRQVEGLINSRKALRQQLHDFFRRVRKHGSFDKAALEVGLKDTSVLEDIKNRWMQYQFGVRPAYADVQNAVEYFSGLVLDDGLPLDVSAKGGSFLDRTYNGIDGSPISAFRVVPRVHESCATHYAVRYQIPTGQVQDVTQLGLDNPSAILWEVTQLSWMVDYVIGIGDWLNSFTATKGMTFVEGCRSTLKKAAASEFNVLPGSIPPGATFTWINQPRLHTRCWFERGSFTRTLLTSGVIPAVVPQIKSNLGLVQLANSLFALSNVFSGGRIYR